MEKNSVSVKWQDNTLDFARDCDTCGLAGCGVPTHHDLYREIEGAAYQEWAESNNRVDADGDVLEIPAANPDTLQAPDPCDVLSESMDKEMSDALAERAYLQLSDVQKEVWDLCMRQGMSEAAAGEQLGKTQQAVSKLLARAKLTFTNSLRENQ